MRTSVNKGIITTRTDIDVFSFTTSGGSVELNVGPDPLYSNLDILLTLKNSSGSVVATADPSSLKASINVTLPAGTYYLQVDGIKGDLGANSDYASLGEYFISGSIPTEEDLLVNITSPATGEKFFAPAEIVIEAEASDEDGSVAKVEFFNGDTKLGEDPDAPYSYNWTNVAAGTYTLTARVTDNHGTSVTSGPAVVTVTEYRNQSPVVSITSPDDGHTLTIPQNPIYITATASDMDGTIAKVEFFGGGVWLGEDQEAP